MKERKKYSSGPSHVIVHALTGFFVPHISQEDQDIGLCTSHMGHFQELVKVLPIWDVGLGAGVSTFSGARVPHKTHVV